MFMEERQQEIAECIEQKGKIFIGEIVEKYGISEESARRDLRILEKQGRCKRTHGGAIRLQQVSVRPAADRDFSKMEVWDNYREIARAAAENIHKNDVIYLCGGSFGFIMLGFLPKDIHYTLVVNSVDIAKELRAWENVDVYVAGGKMRTSGSLVDSLAAEFIRRIHFDLCFLTGAGLSASFGLSNGTAETAAFQRAVLSNSRKKILLMPSAKIGVDS
ncbi:MAG: DeoR/GlpR transcriptional regulator, partial [Firmicutes bacterium]|nr:DeoR/GlpR transcriptional regulator [Bacillota bacterium]